MLLEKKLYGGLDPKLDLDPLIPQPGREMLSKMTFIIGYIAGC